MFQFCRFQKVKYLNAFPCFRARCWFSVFLFIYRRLFPLLIKSAQYRGQNNSNKENEYIAFLSVLELQAAILTCRKKLVLFEGLITKNISDEAAF